MQEICRRQIAQNVHLTCVRMRKFKTACLSVTLMTGLERETAAKSALLPSVLRRGTAVHPDMESLAAAMDDLYGVQIEPLVRKKGEIQCVGFRADLVDDDFVPAGANILEKTAAVSYTHLASGQRAGTAGPWPGAPHVANQHRPCAAVHFGGGGLGFDPA